MCHAKGDEKRTIVMQAPWATASVAEEEQLFLKLLFRLSLLGGAARGEERSQSFLLRVELGTANAPARLLQAGEVFDVVCADDLDAQVWPARDLGGTGLGLEWPESHNSLDR